MIIKAYLLALWILFFFFTPTIGQKVDSSESIRVGNSIFDYQFNNKENRTKKAVALQDFKGERLIIDFFSLGCTVCFANFPKLNNLLKKYPDSVKILAVGLDDNAHGEELRFLYQKFKTKYDLQFSVVYDSILFKRIGLGGVPKYIFIDKKGIVQAVTSSISENQFLAFINDQKFDFDDRSFYGKQKSGMSATIPLYKPIFLNKDSGPDSLFLQGSLLMKGQISNQPTNFGNIQEYFQNHLPLNLNNVSLSSLYRMAYFGIPYQWSTMDSIYGKAGFNLDLRLKDPSVFNEQNLFIYHQLLGSENYSIQKMQQTLQHDLANYFNFRVSIERKKSPCLFLTANTTVKQKLFSKGRAPKNNSSLYGITLVNQKVSTLIELLSRIYGSAYMPLVDNTGINANIDISFNAIMLDKDDVKKALSSYGLNIIGGEQEMDVIVVRDNNVLENK